MHTSIVRSFAIFFFGFINLTAFAQTWTGAVSSDWKDAGNWRPSTVPVYNSEVTVPGTGITNWPVLAGDVSLQLLQMQTGSELDTKGFRITTSKIVAISFKLDGALIKNTNPGTDIIITIFGSTSIKNSIFETNTEIEYSGLFLDRTRIDYAVEGSNHFKGNLKVTESGNAYFALSSSRSIFDGNVEFIRGPFGGTTSGLYTQKSVLFLDGATLNGDFKYTSLVGGELWIGSDASNTNIIGNVEIIHSGPLIPSRNITIGGTSNFKFVGELNSYFYYGSGFSPFVFKNLEVARTGTLPLSISSILTIPGHLTFTSGNLRVEGSAALIFADGATTTGASNSSHVVGQVQKIGDDAFTFPIGDGTKFLPLTISAPSSESDKFRASYIRYLNGNPYNMASKDASLSKVSSYGYWDLTRLSGTSNVQVTLGYNEPAGSITNPSNLRVAHWQGTKWEDLGNGGTSGTLMVGNVQSAGSISSFSPFSLATTGSGNPLPVTLTNFSANSENQTAVLQWSTTSETNSDRFEIEQSIDAKEWHNIGAVHAATNSKSLLDYQFVHSSPALGINYYRLKMIDRDNTFAYSKIVDLKFLHNTRLTLYPNPVASKIYLKIDTLLKIMTVELFNDSGQKIVKRENFVSGNEIDVSNLPEGFYLIKVGLSDGQNETHRIWLKR